MIKKLFYRAGFFLQVYKARISSPKMGRKKHASLLKAISVFVFLCIYIFANAQCDGFIGVSGAGCGCLAGCNLTSYGGPNCGAGIGGDCTAGEVAMFTDIPVINGCAYTVTAIMSPRPGCSASGADGGDKLKVDIVGGVKPFQTGASNATLVDSYTLAGPGTIRVSGTANRADEIITYTVVGGGGCPSCNPLPIDLLSFTAHSLERTVRLDWVTGSEINNDFFTIERAGSDGEFLPVVIIDGAGNSSQIHYYTNFDSSPLDGISYYRLRQTDFNGTSKLSQIVSVDRNNTLPEYSVNVNLCEAGLCYSISNWKSPVEMKVYDLTGRIIFSRELLPDETGSIPIQTPEHCMLLITFESKEYNYAMKFIQ
ncbi:hypothetical protein BH09BAC5_BH09BAC5_18790 [soil metagenome]